MKEVVRLTPSFSSPGWRRRSWRLLGEQPFVFNDWALTQSACPTQTTKHGALNIQPY